MNTRATPRSIAQVRMRRVVRLVAGARPDYNRSKSMCACVGCRIVHRRERMYAMYIHNTVQQTISHSNSTAPSAGMHTNSAQPAVQIVCDVAIVCEFPKTETRCTRRTVS